ncbi:fibronectin type III domain-containing protein [Candidatus Uhrbacteria bacterium]|nr:fibronectin type III domain-containing protein [Candidatus Uhrbacteria bacterium]
MSIQTKTSIGTSTYVKTLVAIAVGAASLAAAAGVIKVIQGERGKVTNFCLEEVPNLDGSPGAKACAPLLDVIFHDVKLQKTDTTAVIKWKTTPPVAGSLRWLKESDNNYGNWEYDSGYPSFQEDHSVEIKNLSPNTKYTFTLYAYGSKPPDSGLAAQAQLSLPIFQFTTLPPKKSSEEFLNKKYDAFGNKYDAYGAPSTPTAVPDNSSVSYSDVQVVQTTDTTATITWQTSKPIISWLIWLKGGGSEYGESVYSDSNRAQENHRVVIKNRSPNTTYQFLFMGFDPATKTYSQKLYDQSNLPYQFTTKAPPSQQPQPVNITPPAQGSQPGGRGGRYNSRQNPYGPEGVGR